MTRSFPTIIKTTLFADRFIVKKILGIWYEISKIRQFLGMFGKPTNELAILYIFM